MGDYWRPATSEVKANLSSELVTSLVHLLYVVWLFSCRLSLLLYSEKPLASSHLKVLKTKPMAM